MKIYVASSWKNPWQSTVVQILRGLGHDAYDYREQPNFRWSEIMDEEAVSRPYITPTFYRHGLHHPKAQAAFGHDMLALRECDACVLVVPCGSSAHLELGYAVGARKRTAVLFPVGIEVSPEKRLGHSLDSDFCGTCSDQFGEIGTCFLPGKIGRVDPELMHACVDEILIDGPDLHAWGARLHQVHMPALTRP